jgi:50S ribosomal subunit-associated GTPase HflX
VYNKADMLTEESDMFAHKDSITDDSIFVSATEKFHYDELREFLGRETAKVHYKIYPNYLKTQTY